MWQVAHRDLDTSEKSMSYFNISLTLFMLFSSLSIVRWLHDTTCSCPGRETLMEVDIGFEMAFEIYDTIGWFVTLKHRLCLVSYLRVNNGTWGWVNKAPKSFDEFGNFWSCLHLESIWWGKKSLIWVIFWKYQLKFFNYPELTMI